jgi:hypothetical protein
MANVGVRKYLNDQGYNDNQIGYNNGQVTLNGKNFYGATPQAADDANTGMMAGSTYGDQNALSNALKTYQGNDRSTMLNNTLGNVNDTVNTKTPFKFTQAKPFQYDTQSIQSDPLYQAAMRQATQGAQTATNNAMVGLGSRGIGNSSVAVDRANQIQQSAVGHVNDTVLPQLMQQAYGRYQDQNNNDYRNQMANYGVGQDQVHNQSALASQLNGLNQQETDNTYRDNVFGEQQKQNNYDAYLKSVGVTGDMGTGAKSDYSLLGDKTGNLSLQGQQFEYGKQMDAAKMQQDAQQFAASQGVQWANLNQRQKEFIGEQAMKKQQLEAQNDPNNLDNKYKQAQIDSLNGKNAQLNPPGIDEYDLAIVDNLAKQAGLNSGKSSPDQVRSFVADLKGKYGWTADEARSIESHLSSGGSGGGNKPSSGGAILPAPTVDNLKNSLSGSVDFFKNIPAGFKSYADYLKSELPKYNPMNLLK